jgi:hypothetical protein
MDCIVVFVLLHVHVLMFRRNKRVAGVRRAPQQPLLLLTNNSPEHIQRQ